MQDVIKDIVWIVWVYEKVFWKLLWYLVYDNELKDCKNILKNVYWYKDVDLIFDDKIINSNFEKLSKIIFRFYEKDEDSKENFIEKLKSK